MRLIDADALINEYMPFIKNAFETNDVLQHTACRNAVFVLKNAPTIDAVPVRRGKWKLNKDGSGTCDQCYCTQAAVWDMDNWQNFCGHCGADMREG